MSAARPPALARALLSIILGRDARVILEEMDELFTRHARRDGAASARRWYLLQLPGFLRRRIEDARPVGAARDDLRQAWRSVARSPLSAATGVLTLGLGVGAATAVFSLVAGAVLRPLPFPHDEQLVRIWENNLERGLPFFSVAPGNLRDWSESSRTLAGAAAWARQESMAFGVTRPPADVLVSAVEPALFRVLDVDAVLGRTLVPEDVGTPAVVLSHGLWVEALGADPAAVGRTVALDGVPTRVVGILGPAVAIPGNPARAWTPLDLRTRADDRALRYLRVVARLAPGSSAADAAEELGDLARRLGEAYPESNAGWGVAVVPLLDTVVDPTTRTGLWILLGVVGMVILVGCGNVASLGVARAAARRHEMAVRTALGAARGRLTRQLLAEAALFATAVGLLGVTLGWGVVEVAKSLGPVEIPRLADVHIDARVLAFTGTLSMVVTALASLGPALAGTRRGLAGLGRARIDVADAGRRWIREVLVVGQVAVAVTLLVGASLLLRSYGRIEARPLGFEHEGLVLTRLTLPEARYATSADVRSLIDAARVRLARIPGVVVVSGASGLPYLDGNSGNYFQPTDRPVEGDAAPDADMRYVAPDYFAAMGIPVLRGDTDRFEASMPDDADRGAIVSERLARSTWPDQEPIGRTFRFGDPEHGDLWTVVGVAGDARYYDLEGDEPRPMIYFPLSAFPGRAFSFAVRTGPRAADVTARIRSVMATLDPAQPLPSVLSMDALLADLLAARRFQSRALAMFALGALLLAAVGLYGLTAYLVRQRAREIGIRIALGAPPHGIAAHMTGRGVALAALGVALGIGAALGSGRVLASLLFGVSTRDLPSFLVPPVVVIVVAALANALPARRASRTDPAEALRAE